MLYHSPNHPHSLSHAYLIGREHSQRELTSLVSQGLGKGFQASGRSNHTFLVLDDIERGIIVCEERRDRIRQNHRKNLFFNNLDVPLLRTRLYSCSEDTTAWGNIFSRSGSEGSSVLFDHRVEKKMIIGQNHGKTLFFQQSRCPIVTHETLFMF